MGCALIERKVLRWHVAIHVFSVFYLKFKFLTIQFRTVPNTNPTLIL